MCFLSKCNVGGVCCDIGVVVVGVVVAVAAVVSDGGGDGGHDGESGDRGRGSVRRS